jgi:hypothetical protein
MVGPILRPLVRRPWEQFSVGKGPVRTLGPGSRARCPLVLAFFSKVKAILRRIGARNCEPLLEAMGKLDEGIRELFGGYGHARAKTSRGVPPRVTSRVRPASEDTLLSYLPSLREKYEKSKGALDARIQTAHKRRGAGHKGVSKPGGWRRADRSRNRAGTRAGGRA